MKGLLSFLMILFTSCSDTVYTNIYKFGLLSICVVVFASLWVITAIVLMSCSKRFKDNKALQIATKIFTVGRY